MKSAFFTVDFLGWSAEATNDNGYLVGNSAAFNVNDSIQSFTFASASSRTSSTEVDI